MCWIAWHPRDLLKFYSSLSKCNVSFVNLYEFAWAVMLIEGFGSIRRQSRSQSPLSLDQRSGESETLVKSRKRQIRWAVEKQFKFPGTVFCFYLPTLLRVSTVEKKSAIYFQKTRTLTVCLQYTVVSRCGLTHSQNTAHARVVIQPEPEFSASGFGSFQSLPHPLRRTKVTEALRIGTFRSDYEYEYSSFSMCTRCACPIAWGCNVNSFCRQNLVAVLTPTTRFSTNLVPRVRVLDRCKGELKG